MVYRVEMTLRASSDLVDIYWRINAADSPQAFAWFSGLENVIQSLDKQPRRGAVTLESAKLRQLLYGTNPNVYRVIYKVDESAQTVYVLHIRHGARTAFIPNEIDQ
ncbi:MAG TPA: type II toxin-antitoxin system RelE/ParE family toxin [Candidatus Angelobacter sp.]|jgi:plasmid stabilization system protein ParE|nr:type II toxin-antitoxin system RelE/ParE family toxin [Candidatus Angelobacter sp.]